MLHFQKYRPDYDDGGPQEICDPGERLDDAIERITKDAKTLADTLGEQVKYLAKRHQLTTEMMRLESGAAVPFKTLEKRVAVLQQLEGFGPEVKYMSLEALKERIALIETINRLEPGEAAPIKKLRERARLLERIALAETVGTDQVTDEDMEEIAGEDA